MKKIFIFSLPRAVEKMLVADNKEEAFERRGEVDPAYEYLPVEVKELEIEGFDIHAKPKKEEKQEAADQAEPSQPEIPVDLPPEEKKPKQPKKPKEQSKK
jgi:hypothetical protein